MSVSGSRMRIGLALKDLKTKWARVSEVWRDPVARAFEENCMNSLEQAVRIAGGALDKMRDAISRARRDCEDR